VRSTVRSRPQPLVINLIVGEKMLTMSYTDDSGVDGTGAQVYRYAISCGLSKKFRIKWRHVAIKSIDSNPLDTFLGKSDKEAFLEKLNDFIRPNSATLKEPCFRITIRKTLSPFKLKLLLFIAGCMKSPINLLDFSLFRPQTYASYFPNVLEEYFGSLNMGPIKNRSDSNTKLVVAHIRGALRNDRCTKIEVLSSMLQSIQKALDESLRNSRIIIITDMPRHPMNWKINVENDPGTLQHWSSQGLINHDDTISLGFFDFENEWTEIRNLDVIRNIEPLECWKLMAEADIFIGCDSSLSIIGGYLNERNGNSSRVFPSQLGRSIPEGWLMYENSVANLNNNEVMIREMMEVLKSDDKF
jgi:hypothetical protein